MSLLAELEKLGEGIVAADIPTDVRKVLGALVHYVETGSLEAPIYTTAAQLQAEHEEVSEVARLQDQVAQLQAQLAAVPPAAPPPPPIAAVPESAPTPEPAPPVIAPPSAGPGTVLPPPSAPEPPVSA